MTSTAPIAIGRYFEGPRWHQGRLYLVDSLARTIVAVSPTGSIETICGIAGISGGMGVLGNGDLMVTSMFDRRLLVYRNGALSRTIDLSGVSKGAIDDMIVAPDGSIYVGDLGVDLLDPSRSSAIGQGRLLLVDQEGSARVVAEGLSFPNGIAVSGDGRLLAVAESDGDCLTRFAIAADGSLRDPVRFGEFGEPDGLCIDAGDAIWVSLFKEDAFVRVDLSGRELKRISANGERAIACALGGADRTTLFAVTAVTTHADLMQGRSRSSLRAFTVETPGAGAP